MSQDVKLDIFYPHPPERVWKALTEPRALAAWMMDNDFEPRLGHKFRFHSHPLPGLETKIYCEVVELDEPIRLVYTWRTAPTAEPSLVIWTLTPVEQGTQLKLEHLEYLYTAAVRGSRHSEGSAKQATDGIASMQSRAGFLSAINSLTLESEKPALDSYLHTFGSALSPELSRMMTSPDTSRFLEWNYYLTQALPSVLLHS